MRFLLLPIRLWKTAQYGHGEVLLTGADVMSLVARSQSVGGGSRPSPPKLVSGLLGLKKGHPLIVNARRNPVRAGAADHKLLRDLLALHDRGCSA